MALCYYCGKDMSEANGCDCDTLLIFIDKWREFPRIKYGDKGDLFGEGVSKDKRCGDCNCKVGYFHHWGCDGEACPECGEQLLYCYCLHKLKENTNEKRFL